MYVFNYVRKDPQAPTSTSSEPKSNPKKNAPEVTDPYLQAMRFPHRRNAGRAMRPVLSLPPSEKTRISSCYSCSSGKAGRQTRGGGKSPVFSAVSIARRRSPFPLPFFFLFFFLLSRGYAILEGKIRAFALGGSPPRLPQVTLDISRDLVGVATHV